ncbi:hypothetical protein P5673_033605 [Acropora cervicornis]|uniref:Uncharacterized protein n=1 Tax=Acropora cervicornis TaxID=6130 RepID=A0AAD9UR83_ACRCE|nr:hypothetical protein P5673_033605 [Acropora cervicornis]
MGLNWNATLGLDWNSIKNKIWLNVDWSHMCVAAYVYQELRMDIGVLLTTSSSATERELLSFKLIEKTASRVLQIPLQIIHLGSVWIRRLSFEVRERMRLKYHPARLVNSQIVSKNLIQTTISKEIIKK